VSIRLLSERSELCTVDTVRKRESAKPSDVEGRCKSVERVSRG
jgi:hypothetical protein